MNADEFFFFMVVSVPIGVYGIQHYVSILGSLILIPLVIVPAMGGSHVSHFIFFKTKLLFCLCMFCFCFGKCIMWILLSDVLVAIGGNCCSGLNCALRVWSDHIVAYIFWVQVALDTRAFFCLSGSSFGDHQLTRVSRTEWKCMYIIIYVLDDFNTPLSGIKLCCCCLADFNCWLHHCSFNLINFVGRIAVFLVPRSFKDYVECVCILYFYILDDFNCCPHYCSNKPAFSVL